MTEKRFAFLDPGTGKTKYIAERKLNRKLDELVELIEKHVAKLKRIDGYSLNGFQATIGITATGPALSLTLAYVLTT